MFLYPWLYVCCVSIIIYCLIGIMYDSITLDTGAYMSYFKFSYGSLWAAQIHNIPDIPIREDDVLFFKFKSEDTLIFL